MILNFTATRILFSPKTQAMEMDKQARKHSRRMSIRGIMVKTLRTSRQRGKSPKQHRKRHLTETVRQRIQASTSPRPPILILFIQMLTRPKNRLRMVSRCKMNHPTSIKAKNAIYPTRRPTSTSRSLHQQTIPEKMGRKSHIHEIHRLHGHMARMLTGTPTADRSRGRIALSSFSRYTTRRVIPCLSSLRVPQMLKCLPRKGLRSRTWIQMTWRCCLSILAHSPSLFTILCVASSPLGC